MSSLSQGVLNVECWTFVLTQVFFIISKGGLVQLLLLKRLWRTWGFYAIITSMEMCDDDFSPERSQLLWTASQLKELKSTLLALSMMQPMEDKKGGEKKTNQGSCFLMFFFFFWQVVRVFFWLLEVCCFFWNPPLAFFWEETYQAHVRWIPVIRVCIPSWFSSCFFWGGYFYEALTVSFALRRFLPRHSESYSLHHSVGSLPIGKIHEVMGPLLNGRKGGGNSNIFWNVHPENWGFMIQFD